MARFPQDAKFDVIGKLRWTFGGKSGFEGILQEMREWRSDLHDIIDMIKFLHDSDKADDQSLYKRLFNIGGQAARNADEMDDIYHGRIGLSLLTDFTLYF
jgi:hypothetical protein